MVPAERKFVAIAVKMLLADMVERANKATLEQREITLGGVCAGIASHIFALAVINGLMPAVKFLADAFVGAPFVGHDRRRFIDVLANRAFECLGVHALDLVGVDFTSTFDQSDNRHFLRAAPAGRHAHDAAFRRHTFRQPQPFL